MVYIDTRKIGTSVPDDAARSRILIGQLLDYSVSRSNIQARPQSIGRVELKPSQP